MSLYYITETNWQHFVELLTKHYSVYGPVLDDEQLVWQKIRSENIPALVVNGYRALQPVKSYFFPAKEEVTADTSLHNTILIGVKACDLGHLQITDAVFTGGVVADPYYAARRENTLIISSDCDDARSSCFCTKMGGFPYPSKGFDLNLSPTRAGYLVEIGTENGRSLIMARKHLFQDPQSVLLKERDAARTRIVEKVKQINQEYTWNDPKDVVKDNFLSKKWEEDIARTCVECDACRFACGTCYCFLLSETSALWGKMRTWDSCQSAGYARVAGGANPRRTRGERLRNLYSCKLVYRHDNYGVLACTGCGRCVEACQGKIDIRKSLQKLSETEK